MKKRYVLSTLAPLLLILAGCSTFSVPRYASSPNIAVTLRSLHDKYPNGFFTVRKFTQPDKKVGNCRMAGPIVTPDSQSYTGYIRTSLIDELKLASMYKSVGGATITGSIKKIDFSSNSGVWIINGQVNIGKEQPLSMKESYHYRTSFGAISACDEVARSYEAAVQDFISKIVASPQFEEALKAQNAM